MTKLQIHSTEFSSLDSYLEFFSIILPLTRGEGLET